MRKSIVLLTLATLTSAFAAGCMPNAEAPVAWFPRPLSAIPQLAPDRDADKPFEKAADGAALR